MHLTNWLQQIYARTKVLRLAGTRPARRPQAGLGMLGLRAGLGCTEELEIRVLLTNPEPVLMPVGDDERGIPAGGANGSNGNGTDNFEFPDGNGWDRTFRDGSGLQQGQPITLTWGIVPDSSPIPSSRSGESADNSSLVTMFDTLFGAGPGGTDLTQRPWFGLFANSLNRWGELSSVTYEYVAITGNPTIPTFTSSATVPDVLIGAHSIDGSSGLNTLAYNYYPDGGDMVIDSDNALFFGDTSNNSRTVRNVLMHEFGHGLGIRHVESSDAEFLMEPLINTAFDGPQLDDILAVQRGYGDRYEKAGSNDTAATGTDLGVIADRATVRLGTEGDATIVASTANDFISIDDESDIDFYKFTVDTAGAVSVTLTPRGPTYRVGPQGGPEASFDAKSQSDLTLRLFGTNRTTVLATSNDTGLGGGELISAFDLLSPGTYYVQVTGATADEIQLYGVSVNFVAAAVPNTPTTPTGPVITSFYPVNGARNVPVSTPLIVTFSDSVVKGTGNILIKKTSDTTTAQSIDVSTAAVTISGAVVTIVPPAFLADSTSYYIVIPDTAFKDTNGVAFGGISLTTTWNFATVDLTPPSVIGLTPADDAVNVDVGANLVVTFNEPVAKGTGFITVFNADDTIFETYNVATSPFITVLNSLVTINPTIDLVPNKGYYVQIASGTFKDLSSNFFGGLTGKTVWNFTAAPPDVTAPVLTSFNPPDDSTDATAKTNLTVTFSERIFKGAGFITIFNSEDDTVFESFDVGLSPLVTLTASNVVTINPTNNLNSAASYYVRITAGAFRDAANNSFAGINDKTTWNFTISDTFAPVVSVLSPADNSVNVPLDSNLVVTFNESVSKRAGIITLFTSDNRVIENFNLSTSTRVSVADRVVTIDPTAELLAGRDYYVRIWDGAFQDKANNLFAGTVDNNVWNFTVAAADTTPPTVASLNPADGELKTAVNSNLVLTFSKNVVPGTGFVTLYKDNDSVFESYNVATSSLVTIVNNVVTINPTADLDENRNYYVKIQPGAFLDKSKNKYAGIVDKTTWNFTTPANKPVFTSDLNASVPENTPVTQVVLDVNATLEAFPGRELVFSLTGADAARFQIDGTTGAVRFLTSPDFEAPTDQKGLNTYHFTAQAVDKLVSTRSAIQEITITVTPVNDNSPIFINPTPTFKIAENVPAGALVGTVGATDLDRPTGPLKYSIVLGNDDGAVQIDSATGALTVANAARFNFEANPKFSLVVAVIDAGTPQLAASTTVTVQLENVAEGPRLQHSGGPGTSLRGKVVNILPQINVIGGDSLPNGGTLRIVADASTIIRGGKLVIVDKYTIPDFKQLGTGNAARIENGKLILEIQLNKNLSAAALQSFLRGVKFATSSSGLKTATRSVNVTLTTGSEAASVVQQTINITK